MSYLGKLFRSGVSAQSLTSNTTDRDAFSSNAAQAIIQWSPKTFLPKWVYLGSVPYQVASAWMPSSHAGEQSGTLEVAP